MAMRLTLAIMLRILTGNAEAELAAMRAPTQGAAESMADKLVDRALQARSVYRRDLEKTTLAKAAQPSVSRGVQQQTGRAFTVPRVSLRGLGPRSASSRSAVTRALDKDRFEELARELHFLEGKLQPTSGFDFNFNFPRTGEVGQYAPIYGQPHLARYIEFDLGPGSAEDNGELDAASAKGGAEPAITIRPAVDTDAEQITSLMNIALMADAAPYRKPEDVDRAMMGRITLAETQAMMAGTGSSSGGAVRFLVAEDDLSATAGLLVGCVRMAMPTMVAQAAPVAAVTYTEDAAGVPVILPTLVPEAVTSDHARGTPALEAQLGPLAVPPGGTGVSNLLIDAAENMLEEAAAENLDWWFHRRTWLTPEQRTLRITVPVPSDRKDLLTFYADRGYQALYDQDEPASHPEIQTPASLSVVEEWGAGVHILYKDVELKRATGVLAR
jgi:hypothetical protein